MAKATTTIRQVLNHEHSEWLRANQALFNRFASFYFDVIQVQGIYLWCSTGVLREVWNERKFGQKCQFDDREPTLQTLWNILPGKTSN